MKRKKIIIPIVFLVVSLCGFLVLSYNSEMWPGDAPELTLPYHSDNPPTGMEPQGETINHANVPGGRGHPGIDFQWGNKTELIAAMDGKVTDIYETEEHGYHEWNVDISNGKYVTRYKELADYNREISIGSKIKRGDLVGIVGSDDPEAIVSRQLHWEFGYRKIIFADDDRLCPIPYFASADADLLDEHWENASYRYRDKFPDLCSGVYTLEG